MSSTVKISAQDLARILDPALRDPVLEARRLATLARIRARADQHKAEQQERPESSVCQAGD